MAGMDMQLTITDVADVPDVSQDIDTYPREVKYVCRGRRPIGLLVVTGLPRPTICSL